MQLTPNFTLSEFTTSQTAARNNIDNTPGPEVLANLKALALQLEKIRALLGVSILISSGYRAPKLNTLIKGSKKSQHILGQAADFTAPRFGTPRQIVEKIKSSGLEFDQLILEFDSWVHISYKTSNNKNEILIIDANGTKFFS